MTLDQALYEMELVGHDFYLFVDKESERPAVVYRRRGYDYGVISLDVERARADRRHERDGPIGSPRSVRLLARSGPIAPSDRAMMRAWLIRYEARTRSRSGSSSSTTRSCSAAA